MDCIECKAANPDGNAYCGKCGAELGHTLDETVRKKDFRDRQATEMEITEAVASRLLKWGGWLVGIATLILASFGFALNLVYRDTRAALDTGKIQIESAVADGKNNINNAVAQGKNNIADATKDIGAIRQNAGDLGRQVSQLRTEIKGYKEVNGEMETLQKQFHGQTSDLTKLDLRVHSLEAVGISGEPTSLSFGPNIGCPPAALAKGATVAYCAQGHPPLLYQRTVGGDLRPVSSLSPIGFQDASLPGPKPGCIEASRGTFYVEKGMGKIADKPLLCVRQSDNSYGWIELAR